MPDNKVAAEAEPEVPKIPVVEEFESCSKAEVQIRLEAVYAALDDLRRHLTRYCKGRSITFKPKECPVRDMMVLAKTITRSTD